MAILASCLVALERFEEVAQIGEYVARNSQFSGNYDIWTFAAAAISVGTLACRRLDDTKRALALFEPVRENPSNVVNHVLYASTLAGLPSTIAQKRPDFSAPAVWEMCGDIEDFTSGRQGTEIYPVEAMRHCLDQCLARIRELIEPSAKSRDRKGADKPDTIE